MEWKAIPQDYEFAGENVCLPDGDFTPTVDSDSTTLETSISEGDCSRIRPLPKPNRLHLRKPGWIRGVHAAGNRFLLYALGRTLPDEIRWDKNGNVMHFDAAWGGHQHEDKLTISSSHTGKCSFDGGVTMGDNSRWRPTPCLRVRTTPCLSMDSTSTQIGEMCQVWTRPNGADPANQTRSALRQCT